LRAATPEIELRLLVDATAVVAKAATALFKIVAHLVDLHNFAAGARFALGSVLVHRLVRETALVSAFAITIAEIIALTTRGHRSTSVAAFNVSEAAFLAPFTVAIFEVTARGRTLGAARTGARSLLVIFGIVGELALLPTLALSVVAEVEAHPLVAAARAGVAGARLFRCTFMLAQACVTMHAPPAEIIPAHLFRDVPRAPGVVGAMTESATIFMRALTTVAPVEALATLTALCGWSDRLSLGMLELAFIAKAATTIVAK